MVNFTVIVIPMLEGNYAYYVHPSNNIQAGYLIDVADKSKVDKFLKDFEIDEISNIMTTHKNHGKGDANLALKKDWPKVTIIGAEYGVPGCNHKAGDEDTISMLNGVIDCHCFAPNKRGPQKGHVLFYMEADNYDDTAEIEKTMKGEYMIVSNINRCVFTGDTIYTGGCTSNLEGDTMLKVVKWLLMLPANTKIFCAHEYTQEHFEFAVKAEPDNEKIREY